MRSVNDLAVHVGMTAPCQAFGLNRGFVYRDRARHRAIGPRRAPPARLSALRRNGPRVSQNHSPPGPAAGDAFIVV